MVNKDFVILPVHLAVALARIFSTSTSLRKPGFLPRGLDEIAAMRRRQTEKRSFSVCIAQGLECCDAFLVCHDSERIPGGLVRHKSQADAPRKIRRAAP